MQKKMTWRYMFATFLFLKVLGVGTLKAQDELMPDFIPPAPTAASLIKFAEIPVGYYTGTPQINIPIYQANGKELNLDISLSYHAGGIKVSEIPGWVGLGWALNAGGVISRTMQGLPDEKDYQVEVSNISELAPYYEGSGIGYFRVGEYFQQGNVLDGLVADKKIRNQIKLGFSRGNIDCEPDLFSFNFCGRAGKFVFDVDENGKRSVRMMPQQDLEIREEIYLNNLVAFRVKDEIGVEYFFDEIEMTTPMKGQYNSSWYLSKIVSASKQDTIVLKYKTDNVAYDFQESQMHYYVLGNSIKGMHYDSSLEKNLEEQFSLLFIDGKKVSEIITSKERIVFESNGGRKDLNKSALRLDGVKIYRLGESEAFKSFTLGYNYFESTPNATVAGATETDKESYRLRLDEIVEVGADGTSLPPHVFKYNWTKPLPRRNSFQQDWWGYFNGQASNDNWQSVSSENRYRSAGYFVPEETFVHIGVLYELDGAKRGPSSDINVLNSGLLKSIQYPTGGSVEFNYEPHDYYFDGIMPAEPSEQWVQNLSLVFEGLGLKDSFEVEDSPKLYKFDFSEMTSTTHIHLTKAGGGFSIDFELFEGGGDTWSEILEPGIYSFDVRDPGVEPENVTHKYSIIGRYSTYSYTEPQSEIIKSVKGGAGGVRISRITNRSSESEKYGVREFLYTQETDITASSGSLVGGFPKFSYKSSEVTAIKEKEPSFVYFLGSDIRYHVRSSSPFNYVDYTQGAPVGYSEVCVKFTGKGTGERNGYVRYYYSVSNSSLSNNLYPFPIPKNIEYLRGKLLKERYFNEQDELLKDKLYKYKWGSAQYSKINGLKIKTDRSCNIIETLIDNDWHSEWYNFNVVDYVLQSDYTSLEKTTETLYSKGTPTQIITEFNYGTPSRLDWKKEYNSEGECLETKYVYPGNVEGTGLGSELTNTMLSRHIISLPLSEEQVNLTKNKIVQGKRTTYDYIKGESQNGIVTRQISVWEQDSYQNKINFDAYNINGQIEQYHKADDIHFVYIWGYEGHYPVAKVQNANKDEVLYENFENDPTIGQVAGGHTGGFSYDGAYQLNFSLPNTKKYVYSYWYYQNGVWKYSGELKFLGTELLSQGERIDDVRVYPMGALMSTYTFDTAYGQTSETDSNGISTFYEYDVFGRLKLIKDSSGNILKRIKYHYKSQN